jgi:hypothetical protein
MRTNLIVPFEEKDEARRLGALWDMGRKVWYVWDMEDMRPFLRWMPERLTRPTKSKPLKRSKKQSKKSARPLNP